LLRQDLQKELAALKNEHERKREQISSAHQARIDASIVGTRTDSYNDLTNELNKPDIDVSFEKKKIVSLCDCLCLSKFTKNILTFL